MTNPVDLTNLRSMTDGDPEMEKELFAEFCSSTEACIATLKGNCTEGANEAWRSSAHALKGTAINLGAEELSALCKRAQEGMAASAAEKQQMLETLMQEYARVKTFLQTVHYSNSPLSKGELL